MPIKIISCISLAPATITSVSIYDFAIAKEDLRKSIILVVENAFAEDVRFHSLNAIRMCVLFAIPTEPAKHMKIILKK